MSKLRFIDRDKGLTVVWLNKPEIEATDNKSSRKWANKFLNILQHRLGEDLMLKTLSMGGNGTC